VSSLLRRNRSSTGGSGPNDGAERVSSRLLPLLMERLESRDRLHVLDLGSGSQGTLNFFSDRNAAIHFVDLFSSELVIEPPEALNTVEACEQLTRYLRLPEGVIFDVCMFWDALHYLSPVGLEGLSRALAPHVGANTLAYGFGSLASGARGEEPDWRPEKQGCRYGIEDQDHLRLTPIERQGVYQAHTQQQLDEYFPALTIQKATLLREGRLELLFARS